MWLSGTVGMKEPGDHANIFTSRMHAKIHNTVCLRRKNRVCRWAKCRMQDFSLSHQACLTGQVWKSFSVLSSAKSTFHHAFTQIFRLHSCYLSAHALYCSTLFVSEQSGHVLNLISFHTCIAHKLIRKHACKGSAEKQQTASVSRKVFMYLVRYDKCVDIVCTRLAILCGEFSDSNRR